MSDGQAEASADPVTPGEPESQGNQGSIWRRWDPHVHLPGTVLNNQFGELTIAEALDLLAACRPAIEAVGVTDYATTATFRAALAAWAGGAGEGLELLFPNVELRLDVPTTAGAGVNLHLLAAPEDVDELDRVLSRLEFTFNGRVYRATPEDLIQLGRKFAGRDDLDDRAALKEGTNQFKVNFSQLERNLTEDDWAREHCLVGFAGGQKDGTSGVRASDGAFEARRREIERFAQIIFSGNPSQREFWLGQRGDDLAAITQKYGSRKLCLHGSDAHKREDLGKPDQNRYCWLKGDSTFSTLKQACIEPEFRSLIADISPADAHEERRIESVVVSSGGWFPSQPVPINPGLVAIIGPRGSGKTALADLMAAGANSAQPFDNAKSFVRRAGSLLDDSVAAVSWTDGEVSTQALRDRPHDESTGFAPPLRYLSQQFVDDLCAVDGVSDLLRKEIERVVFNSLEADERYSTFDFDELLDLKLRAPKARQVAELEAIADLTEEITRLRVLHDSLPSLQEARGELIKKRTKAQEEARELTKKVDPSTANRYTLVGEALQQRERQAQYESRRIKALDTLAQDVSTSRGTTFPSQLSKIRDRNAEADLSDDQWVAFEPKFKGDVDSIISQEREAARTRQAGIVDITPESGWTDTLERTADSDLASHTVSRLRAEHQRLQALVGLDQQRANRLRDVNSQIGSLQTQIERTDGQIVAANEADALAKAGFDQRLERYASYFDALLEEEAILNELYSPLSEILEAGTGSLQKLRFSVQRHVDIATWALTGESFLDLRKEGAFRLRGSLLEAATETLLPAWASHDGADAAEAIRKFSQDHSQAFRDQCNVSRDDADEYHAWSNDLASWLYDADHVELRYTIEYDGIDITRLSPGTRGVVLLLLYLAVDRHETTPLIIDQPEENLDPESVYTELVALFRAASDRRQVIMVTHNANLVVNTDVDQVIVAECGRLEAGKLPTIRYRTGGLEDESIRAAVCQILEGGEKAFRDRARRLRVGWK